MGLSVLSSIMIALAGCSGSPSQTATSSSTSGAIKTTQSTSTVSTTIQTTTAPTVSPLIATYQLDRDLGNTPNCGEPVAEDRSSLRDSEGGAWRVDDASQVGDSVIVNCKGTSVAQYQGVTLGESWKVGASFRPIRNNSDLAQPVCSRLWILDENGNDVFLLTVNNILGQAVEITLEVSNGSWLKLYTPQQWVQTDSEVFYFELSRAENSKRLQILVVDQNGELLRYETSEIRWEDVLNSAKYGGFGVYNSATEFYYWDVQ